MHSEKHGKVSVKVSDEVSNSSHFDSLILNKNTNAANTAKFAEIDDREQFDQADSNDHHSHRPPNPRLPNASPTPDG